MTDREYRLRERIDTLTTERDRARAQTEDLRGRLNKTRSQRDWYRESAQRWRLRWKLRRA